MKKLISLLLAVIMLVSLAVPAFASSKSKLETNEVTGERYEEFTSFYFSDIHGVHYIFVGQNFMIETNGNKAEHYEIYGGDDEYYTKVYAKEGSGFYITRVEARVSSYPKHYGDVGVTAGTKRETWGVDYYDIVHVDDIDSNEFAFSGGTEYVRFDMIRVYYGCAGEHTWDENGKCEICGMPKCKVTGEHNAVLTCSYCGEKLSEGGTASTISEGNMVIVCTAAALAVGLGGGYFLGNKKKKEKA